jgi:hypothetical protein
MRMLVRPHETTAGFLSVATMPQLGYGGKLSIVEDVHMGGTSPDPTGGWACASV